MNKLEVGLIELKRFADEVLAAGKDRGSCLNEKQRKDALDVAQEILDSFDRKDFLLDQALYTVAAVFHSTLLLTIESVEELSKKPPRETTSS